MPVVSTNAGSSPCTAEGTCDDLQRWREVAAAAKQLALAMGFAAAGVAPVRATAHADDFNRWISAGKHGQMDYLARTAAARNDLPAAFPWAKSVLCVAVAYPQRHPQSTTAPATGKIARYAWGRDYHRVLAAMLRRLESRLRNLVPEGFTARAYADTGPLLERELAAHAGLGWVGKHTLLIHPRRGSYLLLGELLTSLPLPADAPLTNHCGSCTRCIDACPTNAITPYSVDATACISYHTLENRGDIPASMHKPMAEAGFLIGCDICQEVCPHNRREPADVPEDFAAQYPAPAVAPEEVAAWTEAQWHAATLGKAHRRARDFMWRRNAAILLGGSQSG